MPDMNPENNRDTFQGRGVQIQQYKDALEKTKKNMMEMERDLYLKINDLEKRYESIRDALKEFREDLENAPGKVYYDKETLKKFILSLEEK